MYWNNTLLKIVFDFSSLLLNCCNCMQCSSDGWDVQVVWLAELVLDVGTREQWRTWLDFCCWNDVMFVLELVQFKLMLVVTLTGNLCWSSHELNCKLELFNNCLKVDNAWLKLLNNWLDEFWGREIFLGFLDRRGNKYY